MADSTGMTADERAKQGQSTERLRAGERFAGFLGRPHWPGMGSGELGVQTPGRSACSAEGTDMQGPLHRRPAGFARHVWSTAQRRRERPLGVWGHWAGAGFVVRQGVPPGDSALKTDVLAAFPPHPRLSPGSEWGLPSQPPGSSLFPWVCIKFALTFNTQLSSRYPPVASDTTSFLPSQCVSPHLAPCAHPWPPVIYIPRFTPSESPKHERQAMDFPCSELSRAPCHLEKVK